MAKVAEYINSSLRGLFSRQNTSTTHLLDMVKVLNPPDIDRKCARERTIEFKQTMGIEY